MKRVIISIILMMGIGSILIINGPRVEEEIVVEETLEKRSIFISYIELGKYLNGKSIDEGKKNVEEMVNNVSELEFNEIILQVRSFADAIYFSEIYPWSSVVSSKEGVSPGYDILGYFIEMCRKNDISIVAWINPYRIRTSEKVDSISEMSPAYKYLNSDIVYVNGGIYFNPSKEEVKKLIVDGVEEIVSKYDVDGILFDDYFYPDNEIDQGDYEKYISDNEYISKDVYNLNVVSEMIKRVHDICNKYGVKFGVSPDGNMDNNYNKVFADVKKWCSSDEYVDFIMPQLYYGFYNETRPFKNTIEEWESIVTNSNVDLRIALAFYKIGEVDRYAKSGSLEWMQNSDIIMRQIVVSRNMNKYAGFSLFRYDYVFNDELYNDITIMEFENMKKVLN